MRDGAPFWPSSFVSAPLAEEEAETYLPCCTK